MSEWTSETADWYAEKYGEYPTTRLAVDHLELAEDSTLLDIGCGTAAALRHASKRITKGTLVGVDPVERMIEIANESLASHEARERIWLHTAPAHKLPVDDKSIDVVLAMDSYDHWGAFKQEGLAEVARVLRDDGRFVVVKDASVPFAKNAKRDFLTTLQEGFAVVEEKETIAEDVSFTIWICTKRG